jgi:hypothetical protein
MSLPSRSRQRRHFSRRANLAPVSRFPFPVSRFPIPVLAAALCLLVAACQAPQPQALEGLGESVLQLGDAVSALQQENAILQDQLDSLRLAVAKQDTALRRFANLAGMPLP